MGDDLNREGLEAAEQEREWTIWRGMVSDIPLAICRCSSEEPSPRRVGSVVVVPKADDVTDNYMVAVSRLKAERDSYKAELEKARKALEEIAEITAEHGGWLNYAPSGIGKFVWHIHSKVRRVLDE